MGGWVEQILIASHAEKAPVSVERVRAIAGVGLEGDRYFAGVGTWSVHPNQSGTALTLIETEVLAAVGLTGAEARRNLVTSGVRLNELVGRWFRIGELICRGVRLCEPCAYLERRTGVTVQALTHRGGLRANIHSNGEISVGDLIEAKSDLSPFLLVAQDEQPEESDG